MIIPSPIQNSTYSRRREGVTLFKKEGFKKGAIIVHKMDSVYTINAFQVSVGVGINITKDFWKSIIAEY